MSAERSAPHEPNDANEHALREGEEAPPPGVALMAKVRWALLVLAAVAAAATTFGTIVHAAHDAGAAAHRYTCAMHPEIVRDAPGECPICHMTLVAIDEERASTAPARAPSASASTRAAGGASARRFTCPMHPEVVRDAPGECPKCHMDLEPVAAPEGGAPDAGAHAPFTAPVSLALDRRQAIGVRTTPVAMRELASPLRLPASVAAPESGAAEVHVRASGYLEHVAVAETGTRVRRGQELATLYSPEIDQLELELGASRALGDGEASARVREGLSRRLELLGVPSATVARVAATGTPVRGTSITAPIDGVVVQRAAVLGAFVGPETALYAIVDLSRAYVVATAAERDLPALAKGAKARFVSGAGEGVAVSADLVYPTVDPETRRGKLRLRPSEGARLPSPGTTGFVDVEASARRALVVPRDALVDVGTGAYVFVEGADGTLASRTVETGAEAGDDAVEVRAGLAAGERVVSSATFLVDSESRLRASLAGATP